MSDTLVDTVTHQSYHYAFSYARFIDPLVRESTSPESDLDRNATYFLTQDVKAGFGITADGTLIALFSLVSGRGDALMRQAVDYGARKLECFDGYLTKFYGRHGFRETAREANWTDGEPDVVWMSLEG